MVYFIFILLIIIRRVDLEFLMISGHLFRF